MVPPWVSPGAFGIAKPPGGVQCPVTAFPLLQIAFACASAALLLLLGVRVWRHMAIASSRKEPIPAPLHDIVAPASGWEAGQRETAVFAGGCFWGYSGGSADTADYRSVSYKQTGHAEAIEIVYDPSEVSYGTLLRIFFSVVHDPTQLNRQGGDVGTQYRSAIFYTDEDQHRAAAAYIQQLDEAHVFPGRIVTAVTPLEKIYVGEDYHQDYAIKNPHNPYIQVCDIPKIASLGRQFPELFQEYSR